MKKLLFYLFTLFTFSVNAQDLQLEVKVNKNPALTSEIIQLQFSINAKGDDFIPPPLSNFHVLSGPASGFNQSYSSINGKTENKISTTISYTLQAKKEGEFTISSASVKVSGKKYKSSPYTIKFVKDINNKSKQSEKTIFISATASKTNVFIGEQFSVIYNLYIKNGINIQKSEVFPTTFDNFWEDGIEINQKKNKREIIDGIAYTVIKYKHSILTPQKSGKQIVPPAQINLSYITRGKLRGYDIFNRPVYHQKITSESLKSKSFNINVKELPTPKPQYFYESVGSNFSLKSEIDRTKLKSGEAINYKIILRGTGNINLSEPFPLGFPDEFDVFDPNVTNKTFIGNKSVNGSKIFEYILIPGSEGVYTIPSFKYSYFDINTEKYVELKTKEYKINVLKGDLNFTKDSTNNISKKNMELEKELNFTKISERAKWEKYYFISFWTLFSFVILLIVFNIYNKNKTINPINEKRRRSTKIAIKRLKTANKCILNNNFHQFFEEIEKSLWGYFGQKFNVESSKLSKENIIKYFTDNNIGKDLESEFINLIIHCEFARYAPSSNKNMEMKQILNRAKEIIIKVETYTK